MGFWKKDGDPIGSCISAEAARLDQLVQPDSCFVQSDRGLSRSSHAVVWRTLPCINEEVGSRHDEPVPVIGPNSAVGNYVVCCILEFMFMFGCTRCARAKLDGDVLTASQGSD